MATLDDVTADLANVTSALATVAADATVIIDLVKSLEANQPGTLTPEQQAQVDALDVSAKAAVDAANAVAANIEANDAAVPPPA